MSIQAQTYVSAARAYANAAKENSSVAEKKENNLHQEDFANLVQGAIKEAVKIGERGESLSIAGINDRADVNQVVTAMAEAELTLQTVITVRDKVIDAYKEILRMPR